MSNSINLRVFYGNGQIRNGPSGVDLSNFPFVILEHPNPEGTRVKEMKIWFTQYFQLDPQIYSVTMQCMWTRTLTPVFWEIQPVYRTDKWQKWLAWCRRRRAEFNILVQPCPREADDSSSAATPVEEEDTRGQAVSTEEVEQRQTTEAEVVVHRQAAEVDEGQADAGEQIEEITAEHENVDRNAIYEEEALLESVNVDGDDGDDEDDEDDDCSNTVIPEEWNLADKARMEVMDNHDSRWEYGSSMVHLNQVFPNRSEMKDAVSRWAVTSHREVFVTVSSPEKYSVKCRNPGCSFYVHAYKPKHSTHWVASRVVQHNCMLENAPRKHRNLTAALVANELFIEIIQKRDMECSFIQRSILRQFKYEITYQKAWRAKQKAMEKRWGTYEASYCNLPRVLEILKVRNPGTYTAFKETEREENQAQDFPTCFLFFRSVYSVLPALPSFALRGWYILDWEVQRPDSHCNWYRCK